MAAKGVIISKGLPSGNTLLGSDSTSGLIIQGVPVGIELGKVYDFYNLKSAEQAGFTEKYDTDNNILAHYHIKEFFREAGEGTHLYVLIAPQNELFSNLVIDDESKYGKALINASKGEIRQLAFAFNPDSSYVPSYSGSLDEEVYDSIAGAQGLALWAYENDRPCQVLIEGRDVQDLASLPDLKALPNLSATKVSLCIGQDYAYAETLPVALQKHAAIGTLSGTVAGSEVSQNIAEVETKDISNVAKGAFAEAGLSSHVTIQDAEAQLEGLNNKGYVFPIWYSGRSGFYWSDDHVCAPAEIDRDGVMNEHSISIGRTLDKAVRQLRAALLPKIKTRQPVDPNTGTLPIGVIKYFEQIGDDELKAMIDAEEISGGKTTVDPESDLLTPPKTLKMNFTIVPYGQIGEIQGTINVKQSL